MTPEDDDYPMTYDQELRAARETLEWNSYLATSSSMSAVRQLPGMDDRAVDIHDPFFSDDFASVRLSAYYDPYSGHHTTGVVIAGSGDDWSLCAAASREPVTIQRAAAMISVEDPATLEKAVDLLRDGLQAGQQVWREGSPALLPGADSHNNSPTVATRAAEEMPGRAAGTTGETRAEFRTAGTGASTDSAIPPQAPLGMESPDAAAQRRLSPRDQVGSLRQSLGVSAPPAGPSR